MAVFCFLIHFIQGKKTYMEPRIYPEEIWNINCIKSDSTDFRNWSKRLAVRSTMGRLYVSQKREVNVSDRQNVRMQELKYWIENPYHTPAWHNCEIILCLEMFYLKSTWWWWGFNLHHWKITAFFHWQNMNILFTFFSLISPSETYSFFLLVIISHLYHTFAQTSCTHFFHILFSVL